MVWKVERWLSEVFPGESDLYAAYRGLKARELAVVSTAVLDATLTELLFLRLNGSEREREEFLGVNGDGRAPVASFGARIQLGAVLGLLTDNDVAVLRSMKKIRNIFAHRVNVDFLTPEVLRQTKVLLAHWRTRIELVSLQGLPATHSYLNNIEDALDKQPEAGEGLLLAIFTAFQAYFHRMHDRVRRLGPALSGTF